VRGVEVGLDTNARKNRTGIAMERLVASYIMNQLNLTSNEIYREMSTKEIYRLSGVDLSIFEEDRIANKRFDFVVFKNNHLYAIEVNFYSGGGSKLNETARSYKMLYEQTKSIENFTFIWITDGIGWNSARGNLEEAYYSIDYVLSIDDLKNNKLIEIIK
ncbi:MAG: DpnII family type II restriction endonuclease, partial [bacterium]|nr:DpnII family type II restriction endonuclease [bacterium]